MPECWWVYPIWAAAVHCVPGPVRAAMRGLGREGQGCAVFDPGTSSGRSRSLACASGTHQECGHVSIGMRRKPSPDRLESIIALCRCSCHAACPLAGRMPVPLTVWQQLCPCPGGQRHRAWKDDPDEPWPGFREEQDRGEREWQNYMAARKQAFEATQAAAAGKTRDELRDLYIAELRARGQEVPLRPDLDVELEFLSGHPLRALWKMRRTLRRDWNL